MVGITLVTVAAEPGEIPAHGGTKTIADFGYDDAPKLDYLLVPGGWGAVPLVID